MAKTVLIDKESHFRLNNGAEIKVPTFQVFLYQGRMLLDAKDFAAVLDSFSIQAISDQKQEVFRGLAELIRDAIDQCER